MIAKVLILAIALNNITLKVTGLTCSMCSFSVQKSVEKVYLCLLYTSPSQRD